MSKADGQVIELALNGGGRGKDLALLLAVRQLLHGVDYVFNPKLTNDDLRVLKILTEMSSKLTEERFDIIKFSNAIIRGKWGAALESVTEIATEAGVSGEEAFSALLGILLVPSCFVDQFTISIINNVSIGDIKPRRENDTPLFKAMCKSLGEVLNREALFRFAAAAAALKSRNPDLFEWAQYTEEERKRFERYHKALQLIYENSEAYSEVIRLVNKERWVEANEIATKYFRRINLNGYESLNDIPALADFLILALTNVWDPAEVSRVITAAECETRAEQPRWGTTTLQRGKTQY